MAIIRPTTILEMLIRLRLLGSKPSLLMPQPWLVDFELPTASELGVSQARVRRSSKGRHEDSAGVDSQQGIGADDQMKDRQLLFVYVTLCNPNWKRMNVT